MIFLLKFELLKAKRPDAHADGEVGEQQKKATLGTVKGKAPSANPSEGKGQGRGRGAQGTAGEGMSSMPPRNRPDTLMM